MRQNKTRDQENSNVLTSLEFIRANEVLETLNVPKNSTMNTAGLSISPSIASVSPQMAYHELADVPVRETDILDQLDQNISNLEILRARYQFVMREIRYLVKA